MRIACSMHSVSMLSYREQSLNIYKAQAHSDHEQIPSDTKCEVLFWPTTTFSLFLVTVMHHHRHNHAVDLFERLEIY